MFILKCKTGQPVDLERGFELGEQVCREAGVNMLGLCYACETVVRECRSL